MLTPSRDGAVEFRTRRLGWAIASLGIGLTLAILLTRPQRPSEPVHGGRRLSQWLEAIDEEPMGGYFYMQYDNDLELQILASPPPFEIAAVEPAPPSATVSMEPWAWDETAAALRAMGTEAVPFLLWLLKDHETWWDRFRMKVWARFPYRRFYPDHAIQAEQNRWRAQVGFRLLGEMGSGAVPELERMLRRPGADLRIGVLLAGMGPAGHAVLTNSLSSQHASVRNAAAAGLLEEGVPAGYAVPALKQVLQRGSVSYWTVSAVTVNRRNTREFIEPLATLLCGGKARFEDEPSRRMVICLLGLYGSDAVLAVPVLLQAAGEAGDRERYYIGRALVPIDAEAAGRFEMEEAARAAALKSR